MRVGIYARVSTHDQQTLPMQLEKMQEYIKHRGWTLTKEVEEVGSGAKTRPKREELLRMAKRREIDAILVWKLDRFGRSLADLVFRGVNKPPKIAIQIPLFSGLFRE